MSEIILYQRPEPDSPPAGGAALYLGIDNQLYWKLADGTVTPFYPTGAGTGDLLSNGTIPLSANWDVGAFEITMLRAHFDTTTGQPFTVVSTDMVNNLNADRLDGYHASAFQLVGSYLEATDIDTLAKLNGIVSDATLWDWAATTLVGSGFFLDEDNMASDDATKVPSQQSVKAYVDLKVQGANIYQGPYNATTNSPDLTTSPNSILKGQYWVVDVAGTFFTANVEVGDTLIAEQDDPSVEAHWTILQTNLDAASIKSLYESNSNTNAFEDNDVTKLDGIDPNASLKSNLTATTAPTATDDSGSGYAVGSKWVDVTADLIYFCVDATVAAAIWQDVGSGGGGGLVVEFKTADFTAEAGKKYKVDSTLAPVDVTMPAGTDLDNIVVQDVGHYAGTNHITLTPNGAETIDNDTVFVIDQDDGDADLGYDSANTNWAVSPDGSPSLVNVNDFSTGFSATNTQTGTTYEFVENDLTRCVYANNAAASTYDIPDGLAADGETLNLLNIGAGLVTITVAGTDTLDSSANTCPQGDAITIICEGGDSWRVIGGTA